MDKLTEYKINSYLIMDEVTRHCLELTKTRNRMKTKGSVYWFLNYTKTPMGTRLLKKYLSEPLLDEEIISNRLNAVEELISNTQNLEKCEQILDDFCDLSRMCAKLSNTTIYPKDLYLIVKDSVRLKNINKIIKQFKSKLLKMDEEKLNEVIEIAEKINLAINENSSNDIKNGSIINDGYDSNLDYLRLELKKMFCEMSNFELKQQKITGIKNLKIKHSKIIGYYIEISNSKQHNIPKEYYKKQTLTNCIRYSCDELKNIEIKINNLKYRINELEYALYCEIRKSASKYTQTIRLLAKDIANIDVLISYSRCAINNNFVKPKFNKTKINIKNGFHPSLMKLNNEIIKNDTNLDFNTMMILTGANMSGKSTFLKYNALISLLSQIGSYVPATSADVSVLNRIFLRQGSTDDIINNNSSFMVEMNDLKYILDNITDSSLVLLDEPAKSTNAREGGAIARAFCEYLLEKSNAKVILVTHNYELTKLENDFPTRALNYVIGDEPKVEANEINRKIKRGKINGSYALATAKLAGLPKTVLEKAKKYM